MKKQQRNQLIDFVQGVGTRVAHAEITQEQGKDEIFQYGKDHNITNDTLMAVVIKARRNVRGRME